MRREDQKKYSKGFVLFYICPVTWLITFDFLLYRAHILKRSITILSNNFSLIHREEQICFLFFTQPST